MAGGTAQFNDQINDFLDGVGSTEFRKSKDLVDKVLQKYTEKWQKNLQNRGINASRNLSQSIGFDAEKNKGWEFEFSKDGKLSGIKLYLPEYYEYTDLGRRLTKKDGNGDVFKKLSGKGGWISQKKIKVKTTYLSKWKTKDGTEKSKEIKYISNEFGNAREKANKALAFLISRKIHTGGFNSTYQQKRKGWFSSELKSFEKELVEAFNKVFTNIGEINISINPK